MSFWVMAILVFIVDSAVSFAWAECIKAIGKRQAILSGIWAGVLTLCGAFTIINYTNNHWFLIPATAGAVLGTYLSVKFKKDDS